MIRPPIPASQFVRWFAMWTLVCGYVIFAQDILMCLPLMYLTRPEGFLPSLVERRTGSAKFTLIMIVLSLVAVLSLAAVLRTSPECDAYFRAGMGFLKRPAFIIPFWALVAGINLRRWRASTQAGPGAIASSSRA